MTAELVALLGGKRLVGSAGMRVAGSALSMTMHGGTPRCLPVVALDAPRRQRTWPRGH